MDSGTASGKSTAASCHQQDEQRYLKIAHIDARRRKLRVDSSI